MTRISTSRATPAIVVAALALVAAVTGTAVAGDPGASSSALTKKKVKKLVKKEVAKQIGKATGPEGPQGPQGPAGPRGPAGPANVRVGQVVRASFGQTGADSVVIAVNEGFSWQLSCDDITGSTLRVVNVSGGDNSHVSTVGGEDENFDNGDTLTVASTGSPNDLVSPEVWTLIYGTATDSTQAGFGGVLNEPVGFGSDCVASLNLLAL
jgi:hypothetical protein